MGMGEKRAGFRWSVHQRTEMVSKYIHIYIQRCDGQSGGTQFLVPALTNHTASQQVRPQPALSGQFPSLILLLCWHFPFCVRLFSRFRHKPSWKLPSAPLSPSSRRMLGKMDPQAPWVKMSSTTWWPLSCPTMSRYISCSQSFCIRSTYRWFSVKH